MQSQISRHPPSAPASALPANFERLAGRLGWIVAAVGGIILLGWVAGLPLLKSLFPGQVEAKANTAVCFILAGGALAGKSAAGALPGGRRMFLANLCASLCALTGLLTLGEYLFGWQPGIDELLFRESPGAAFTVFPGRMAVASAVNFSLLGSALLFLDRTRPRAWLAWGVAPAAILAGLAFVGHLYDLPLLATLGPFTPIAAPTGMLFLVLCAGVLLAGCPDLIRAVLRSGRTLGFVTALLLLAVMGGAVVRNATTMQDNTRLVQHTHEVLNRLNGLLDALQNAETGTRGYLLTGDAAFLEPYRPAPAAAERLGRELRVLMADNPVQRQRLAGLEGHIALKLASARQQIELRQQGRTAAAQANVTSGEGRRQMDAIRQGVADLEQEERRLLAERQARMEASTGRTLLTLGTGLAICGALLITIFFLLRREIARRARTEEALRRSEESLAVTLHSIGDAVLATDVLGRITLMNRVGEELTGWPLADARGRPIAEVFRIFHEETRAPATIPVDAALATGEIQTLANHTVLVARDGTEHAIADSAAPIRDDAGVIRGVVLVFRDVTAEQATRRALRESEARYRTLFDSIDEGFCVIGMIFDDQGNPVDYRFLEINPSFEKQTGLANALGKRMKELAPQHEAHWFEIYGRIALTGEPARFQNRAEQLHRWYDVYAFRFGAPENRQVAILFHDITARIEAEAERDRFFTLSVDFLGIAKADGFFKRVSPAVTDLLGWSTGEFLATPFIELVHPEDRAATLAEVERQVVRGEKVLQFENRYRHKDGSWRVLSWRSVPQPGGLMYATARDVTARRQSEEQIRRLNAELSEHAGEIEAANKELEAFSYSVSHDLRAPLRHVQGYVGMLTRELDGQLSEKARRYLQTIADAGQEMGTLIDDLLSFSRMGQAELRETTVDLETQVQEVRRGLEPFSQGRQLNWTIAPLPKALGDPAMLKQVWANLLGNAVKYTRGRAVAEIAIGCAGVEAGRLVIFVRDNGAGFDMQYAGKLFGVFQRLHRAEEFEGTGIGLANVRRIITRHGGRTWAEGQTGVGATFFFTLAPAAAG